MSAVKASGGKKVGLKSTASTLGVTFDVGEHVDDVVDLDFNDLKLDLDLQYGQVRNIQATHRDTLVTELMSNPPKEILTLTT